MGLNTGKLGPREQKFKEREAKGISIDYKWVDSMRTHTLNVAEAGCALRRLLTELAKGQDNEST